MINTIIIDDEPYCCETLEAMIGKFCPELAVAAVLHSGGDAMDVLEQFTPQLVFLDIEMPHMNGFEFLEKVHCINFELIFTTSYDQYAIKAIRLSALDYLLKPVDREELQKAVQKAAQRNQHSFPQQLDMLLQKLKHPAIPINKIAIPTMEGYHLLAVDSIISCESESNYTCLFLKGKHKIIASRSLKEMEEILEDYPFVRIHHSYVVNINEVEKYIKGEGGYLIMSDGSTINVSRSRKELLLKKLSLR